MLKRFIYVLIAAAGILFVPYWVGHEIFGKGDPISPRVDNWTMGAAVLFLVFMGNIAAYCLYNCICGIINYIKYGSFILLLVVLGSCGEKKQMHVKLNEVSVWRHRNDKHRTGDTVLVYKYSSAHVDTVLTDTITIASDGCFYGNGKTCNFARMVGDTMFLYTIKTIK